MHKSSKNHRSYEIVLCSIVKRINRVWHAFATISRSDNARALPLQFIQNHSLPNAGTEYTPQWMNTPNLAWSYHVGSGLASRLVQSGSYRWTSGEEAADAHAEVDIHAMTMAAKTTPVTTLRFGIFPFSHRTVYCRLQLGGCT